MIKKLTPEQTAERERLRPDAYRLRLWASGPIQAAIDAAPEIHDDSMDAVRSRVVQMLRDAQDSIAAATRSRT